MLLYRVFQKTLDPVSLLLFTLNFCTRANSRNEMKKQLIYELENHSCQDKLKILTFFDFLQFSMQLYNF